MRLLCRCLPAAGTLLILAVGCRSTTSPSGYTPCVFGAPRTPPSTWPATVNGCWVQHGVDTWTELHLAQQGSVVSGTYAFCGPVGGCAPVYQVSGTVALPSVVLHWNEQNGETYQLTFDATLSAQHDALAGTLSTNGQPPGPTIAFYRVAAQ